MSDFVDLIPYETPQNQKQAADRLAEIIGIPKAMIPRDADCNVVVAARLASSNIYYYNPPG